MYLKIRQALLVGVTGLSIWGAVGFQADASPGPALVPPCQFQVDPETHRELVVWSNYTGVKGTVQVWHKNREWRSTSIKGGEWQFWNLKRSHQDASHFTVGIIAQGTKPQNEWVWWCEEV